MSFQTMPFLGVQSALSSLLNMEKNEKANIYKMGKAWVQNFLFPPPLPASIKIICVLCPFAEQRFISPSSQRAEVPCIVVI